MPAPSYASLAPHLQAHIDALELVVDAAVGYIDGVKAIADKITKGQPHGGAQINESLNEALYAAVQVYQADLAKAEGTANA